ncbi:hypothetical protein GCM10029992_26040 [Glycomyces albus]
MSPTWVMLTCFGGSGEGIRRALLGRALASVVLGDRGLGLAAGGQGGGAGERSGEEAAAGQARGRSVRVSHGCGLRE